MTALYDRMKKTAHTLIQRYGGRIVWRKFTPTTGARPDEPGPATPKNVGCYVVFLSSDQVAKRFAQFMPQTEVPGGFECGLLSAMNCFVPALNDVIIRNGKEIQIEWIDPLAPSGDALLYRFGFAK